MITKVFGVALPPGDKYEFSAHTSKRVARVSGRSRCPQYKFRHRVDVASLSNFGGSGFGSPEFKEAPNRRAFAAQTPAKGELLLRRKQAGQAKADWRGAREQVR